MKQKILIFTLLLVVVLSGCRNERVIEQTTEMPVEEPEITGEQPVIEQDDVDQYEVNVVQNPDGTFTCMDNSTAETAEKCMEIAIDLITNQRLNNSNSGVLKTTVIKNPDGTFKCGDGSIADSAEECGEIALSGLENH